MMHRTHPLKALLPSFHEPQTEAGLGRFCQSDGETPHALFAPLHYERNYAYPLLVWLHGPGDDERQLVRIMPLVSMRNYVAVAPRGLAAHGCQGADWQQSEEQIQQAEQRVFDAVEIARRKLNVNRRRVFLGGFDTGGTMALRIALRQPGFFAGTLSLCGRFPQGSAPLEHLVDVRRVPLFLAVGRHSSQYPSAEVCRHLRLLHTAGISLTLRQYPCGHQVIPQMLADVDRWIIEQLTPAPSSSTASV